MYFKIFRAPARCLARICRLSYGSTSAYASFLRIGARQVAHPATGALIIKFIFIFFPFYDIITSKGGAL